MRLLSFFTCAVLAAATACGVEVIDLTAAARKAGKSSFSVSATNEGSSHKANGAFDGVYSGNSAQVYHSVSADGLDVTLSYQFNDTFMEGKNIRLVAYYHRCLQGMGYQ